MDQFEREDSSTYSEPERPVATEPVKEDTPVRPPVQEFPKEKKSKAPLVLSVLLILALAGAGALGWLWYQQNGEVDNVRADLASAKNKISQLESVTAAETSLDESDEDVTTNTKDSDSEAIIKAVLAYAKGDVNVRVTGITAEIKTVQESFASATYANPSIMASGGGLCILKKSEGIWLVLYCAQADSEYTLQLDKQFGVPNGLK